jgi:hypothetical protein
VEVMHNYDANCDPISLHQRGIPLSGM